MNNSKPHDSFFLKVLIDFSTNCMEKKKSNVKTHTDLIKIYEVLVVYRCLTYVFMYTVK